MDPALSSSLLLLAAVGVHVRGDDAALGVGFLAAAALLRNESSSVRLPLLGFGFVALTAAALTDAGPDAGYDIVLDPGVP